ncbi:MAG: hypothetical protein V1793_09455 [Pseudomonadota bacterium]
MPLAFTSISHGSIAFGFFNIESDMLLLENNFFFASDFCDVIASFSKKSSMEGLKDYTLAGYRIDRPKDVGDLMGAIHGMCYTGFMGALYRLFPFPEKPGAFKQNPQGFMTREQVAALILDYGQETDIPLGPAGDKKMRIRDVSFDMPSFQALVKYVWMGGYPRWKEEKRPAYVHRMRTAIDRSKNPFFKTIRFEDP